MKRAISLLLLIALLTSVLCGCGTKAEESADTPSGDESPVISLPDELPAFEPLDWTVVEDTPAEDFTYELREATDPVTDERGYVVDLISYNGDDNIIKIPDKIEGCYVVTADTDMFHDNTSITHVCLPSYLLAYFDMLDGFFSNCTSLVQVQMPLDCYSIPDSIFYGCTSLRQVTFPVSGDEMSYSSNEVGSCAFSHCTSLTEITLPENIKIIGDYAFMGCIRLESITLASVEKICNGAFEGCTSLKFVKAPNATIIWEETFKDCVSLTELELSANNNTRDGFGSAFNGCSALQTVTFVPSEEESDGYLTMEDGKIYRVHTEKDGSTTSELIRVLEYYRDAEISLREDCVTLCSHAFDNIAFKTYEIPASVEKVESYTFENCPKLQKVTEEAGANKILVDDNAFDNCPLLRIIDLSVRPWDPAILSGTREGDIYGYSCPALEAVYLPGDDPDAAPLTKDSITEAIEAVFENYADEMEAAGFTYEINCNGDKLSQVLIFTNKESVSSSDGDLLKKLTLAVIGVPEADLDEALIGQLQYDSFTSFGAFNYYFCGADKVEFGCWEDRGCLVLITNN